MFCKICHQNQAITTDCRCGNCLYKPEIFTFPDKKIVWDTNPNNEEITPEEQKNVYDKVFNRK